MIGITNVGGGKVVAFVVCTYPTGSICTCTKGTKIYRAKDTSGSFVFMLKEPGTWTVSCTDGTETDSKIITVAMYDSIAVSLAYDSIYKLAQDVASWGLPVRVSMAVGDYFYHTYDIFKATRTSDEPVIFIPFSLDGTGANWGGAAITASNALLPHTYASSGALALQSSYIKTNNGHKLYWSAANATSSFHGSQYPYVLYTADMSNPYSRDSTIDDDGVNFGITKELNEYGNNYLTIFGTATEIGFDRLDLLNDMLDRYAIFTGAEVAS